MRQRLPAQPQSSSALPMGRSRIPVRRPLQANQPEEHTRSPQNQVESAAIAPASHSFANLALHPIQQATQSIIQAKRQDGNNTPNQLAIDPIKPNRTGLPDRLKTGIEHLSGYSMDDVQVHYNSAKPAQLQAQAYTQGTQIHLGPGQEQHLPHEGWHVVQQMQGRVTPTMQFQGSSINDDSALESEADAMGTTAMQVTQPQISSQPQISLRNTPTIQRYIEKTDADSDPWRMSESGKSALWITQAEGGQTLFAAPDLIKQANAALTNAGKGGSFVRLVTTKAKPRADLLEGLLPSVRGVVPKLVTMGPDPGNKKLRQINKGLRADDDGTQSKEFAMWADCGRSSRAVMGTDGMGGAPKAEVTIGGEEKESQPSYDPAAFTEIYAAAMPDFMMVLGNRQFLKAGIHYDTQVEKAGWKFWKKDKIMQIMKTPATSKEAKEMYWELGKKGRRAFDQQTGINTAADPKIGGAYTMSTEHDMPGFKAQGAKTWNFHWAGVVMKDGANNVTLENYAVSYGTDPDPVINAQLQQKAYDEVNRSWVFQMYGTQKKDQSFHEEHLKSGTHGNRGSSFAVEV